MKLLKRVLVACLFPFYRSRWAHKLLTSHFLWGAYDRAIIRWRERHPGWDQPSWKGER